MRYISFKQFLEKKPCHCRFAHIPFQKPRGSYASFKTWENQISGINKSKKDAESAGEGIRTVAIEGIKPLNVSPQLISLFSLREQRFGRRKKHMTQRVMNCPHCGRILPREYWPEKSQVNKQGGRCPRCGSNKSWKDAKRYTTSGVFQRYYCRECGRGFSIQVGVISS